MNARLSQEEVRADRLFLRGLESGVEGRQPLQVELVRQKLGRELQLRIRELQTFEPARLKLEYQSIRGMPAGAVLQNAVRNQLEDELKRSLAGSTLLQCNSGVLLIAIPQLSTLDMIGCDFLLVDSKSGNFLILDSKENPTGIEMLPRLKKVGLLYAPDFSMNLGWGLSDAQYLVSQLVRRRLPELLQELPRSPLNLLDIRLPLYEQGLVWEAVSSAWTIEDLRDLREHLQFIEGKLVELLHDCRWTAEYMADDRQKELLLELAAQIEAPPADGGKAGDLHVIRAGMHTVESKLATRQPVARRRP
jgi:hypothetical protein